MPGTGLAGRRRRGGRAANGGWLQRLTRRKRPTCRPGRAAGEGRPVPNSPGKDFPQPAVAPLPKAGIDVNGRLAELGAVLHCSSRLQVARVDSTRGSRGFPRQLRRAVNCARRRSRWRPDFSCRRQQFDVCAQKFEKSLRDHRQLFSARCNHIPEPLDRKPLNIELNDPVAVGHGIERMP